MKLFYIGRQFYQESQTIMSPLYEEGSKRRSDWGKVKIALDAGDTVTIRPATEGELVWAIRMLKDVKLRQSALHRGDYED